MPNWITDAAFASRTPRNVFHRQLEPLDLPADPLANAHILFRRRFSLDSVPTSAVMRITADDYYKLSVYITMPCSFACSTSSSAMRFLL